MKKIVLLLSMGLLLFSCGPQENPDPDTVIITQNGITLEIPAGAFENDGEIFMGKTGDEPTSVPNPDLTVVGEPFTLKLPVDTLLAPITLSFPLPEESLTVNNGVFLLYNGTSYCPYAYEIVDGKVVVTIDTINWGKVSTKASISENIAIFINDLVHIDNESLVGLNKCYVVNDKVYYTSPSTIGSSSRVLLFVHGLIGDPTGWEGYIKKINLEPYMLSYTDIWTYGYHSGQNISSIGEDLYDLLYEYTKWVNPTIHIVAHSMGGLVSRSMIENSGGAEIVDKLITLGTPHQGSSIAVIRHIINRLVGDDIENEDVNSLIHTYYSNMQSANDLDPTSRFIFQMGRLEQPPINCPYYTIAAKISVGINAFDWNFFSIPHDGLVSVNSAKGVIGGIAPSYDVSIPYWLAHMKMRTFDDENSNINSANEELYTQVVTFLKQGPLTVSTGWVFDITTTTASCTGNVTSDGGAAIIASGVCWSTSQNPTTSNSKTTNGTGLGTFTSNISGLSPNTTYYVRAYATNANGTAYGEQRTFKTQQEQDPGDGSFTDSRDGNVYKTVTIGDQLWMAENLAYLPAVSPSSEGGGGGGGMGEYSPPSGDLLKAGPSAAASDTEPRYYVYEYSGTNVEYAKATTNYQTYGVLYNWPAAMTACPSGWHLPSDEEWTQLETYLANNGHNYDGSVGGDNFRDKIAISLASATGWDADPENYPGAIGNTNPAYDAYRNKSGFSALPGGYRNLLGGFNTIGILGYWWSSAENYTNNAWYRNLYSNYSGVYRYDTNKDFGLSVRCLRD
ncbi:MAG: FISUMP domain-containing protein [Bacteroidales bacterium]|nr:FISUMP domain-containing protein [Bacteroidales bacterium]